MKIKVDKYENREQYEKFEFPNVLIHTVYFFYNYFHLSDLAEKSVSQKYELIVCTVQES